MKHTMDDKTGFEEPVIEQRGVMHGAMVAVPRSDDPPMTAQVSTEPPPAPKPHHSNPIRTAYMQMMVELGRGLIEKNGIPAYPVALIEPDDHRAVKTCLDNVAMAMGRFLRAVGQEVNRNAVIAIDMKDFEDTTFRDALDGFAFFEIERAAEAAADELEDARRGRQSSDYGDMLFDEMRRINKALYGV